MATSNHMLSNYLRQQKLKKEEEWETIMEGQATARYVHRGWGLSRQTTPSVQAV